jgi:hypothetical protein
MSILRLTLDMFAWRTTTWTTTTKPVASTSSVSAETVAITASVSTSIAISATIGTWSAIESIIAFGATAAVRPIITLIVAFRSIGAFRTIDSLDAFAVVAYGAPGVATRRSVIHLITATFAIGTISAVNGAIEIAASPFAFSALGTLTATTACGAATPAATTAAGIVITLR